MPRSRNQEFEERFDALLELAERVARRVVGAERAEDVAMEVLTKVLVRWSKLRDADYLEAWVAKVAFNEALDAYRKTRRRQVDAGTGPTTQDAADVLTVRLALCEALAALPRRQREVVALRFLADLSQAQTAAALGLSAGSVAQHTSRGLAALRSSLGPAMRFDLEVQS